MSSGQSILISTLAPGASAIALHRLLPFPHGSGHQGKDVARRGVEEKEVLGKRLGELDGLVDGSGAGHVLELLRTARAPEGNPLESQVDALLGGQAADGGLGLLDKGAVEGVFADDRGSVAAIQERMAGVMGKTSLAGTLGTQELGFLGIRQPQATCAAEQSISFLS